MRACATCRFGAIVSTHAVECRRSAPPAALVGSMMQPATLPLAWWCGDWRRGWGKAFRFLGSRLRAFAASTNA